MDIWCGNGIWSISIDYGLPELGKLSNYRLKDAKGLSNQPCLITRA